MHCFAWVSFCSRKTTKPISSHCQSQPAKDRKATATSTGGSTSTKPKKLSTTLSEQASKKIVSSNSIKKNGLASDNKKGKTLEKTGKASTPSSRVKSRPERVYGLLADRNTQLYCFFLKSVLGKFNDANLLLQKEEPYIHKLHITLEQLVKDIVCKFIKPSVIQASGSITEINFQDTENQKSDHDLAIGHEAREFLSQDHHIDRRTFFSDVRKFFVKAAKYMVEKFPIGDELLVHAQVADISRRTEVSFCSIVFFTKRFPILKTQKMDQLEEQFLSYQIDNLPEDIVDVHKRTDEAWSAIGQLRSPITNQLKYKELAKVMTSVLVIFHSNADCERIFSLVTKNKTKFRPNMTTVSLSGLITHKVNMLAKGETAYSATPSSELLKKAKSATYQALK